MPAEHAISAPFAAHLTFPGMPRWWWRCLVVAVVGLGLTVAVVADPVFSFAFTAPVARAVLETAVTIVGCLVVFLVIGRYRRRRRPVDLGIAVALGVLALSYPLFVGMFSIGPGAVADVGKWIYLLAHASAAGLLCWAAFQPLPPPDERAVPSPWTREAGETERPVSVLPNDRPTALRGAWSWVCTVMATVLVSLALLAHFGFDPDATNPPVTAPVHLLSEPGISAVRLLSFFLFAGAALGFLWRNRSGVDHLIGWLSVGCTLLAVGDLEYGLFPPASHGQLHLGDVFRLAAVLVFAIGAAAEIRSYWYESRRLARLEERRSVAADLHDGIAQELAFLSAQVRAAEARAGGGPWLAQLRAASDRALSESRRAIAALVSDRPLALRGDISDAVHEVTDPAGVRALVDVQPSWVGLVDREAVVRIVREAVVNAVRHGSPTTVAVELSGSSHPTLRIVDDGTGFDPSAIEVSHSRGYGITGMRERARSIGAHFRIVSSLGQGTTVELWWPSPGHVPPEPAPASVGDFGLASRETTSREPGALGPSAEPPASVAGGAARPPSRTGE